jgi:ERCC4-type nuclease
MYVDSREHYMIDYLHSRGVEFERCTLPVGDYVLVHDEYPIALVERKTWSDLQHTIKDARKHNHDSLVRAAHELKIRAVYIMEGGYRPQYTACRTFLHHRIWQDGITVLYSNSIQHTYEVLTEFSSHYVHARIYDPPSTTTSTTSTSPWMEVLSFIKQRQYPHPAISMWCCIPSVGIVTARTLFRTTSIRDVYLDQPSEQYPYAHIHMWLHTHSHTPLWASVKGISMSKASTFPSDLMKRLCDQCHTPSLGISKALFAKLYSIITATASDQIT